MCSMPSLPPMAPRYTVLPVHMRSLPFMAPRYSVHPVHKKAPRKPRGKRSTQQNRTTIWATRPRSGGLVSQKTVL